MYVIKGLALWDALAAGRDKKGELATTSLEFEYLHRKSRCEMLIGGDDISNDVITLGTCFSMFVYIRADWRKSDSSVNQEPKGKWRWNSNLRLSKDLVSDAFGLNSTKSRETAGVVVLVFFFLKQRGGRRQREEKKLSFR